MKPTYRKIVADLNRQYRYRVRLTNAGDWRSKYCNRQHFVVTGGALVMWYEKDLTVFSFTTAEQATAFQLWAHTCGIDWTVVPGNQPPPYPPLPPPSPVTRPGYTGHSVQAVDRNAPASHHSR